MTDFDSLREDFARAYAAIEQQTNAQNRLNEELLRQDRRLWADNAELRDELHALANRIEALTRVRFTTTAGDDVRSMDRRQT